jgi:four helix bundle protein
MQNFRNLKVWDRAHALTLDVYQSSRSFPRDEMYGLTSQMRRASASIGANIAEGSCRGGDIDFARFLQIATGSASELEYHLILAPRPKLAADARLPAPFRQSCGSETNAGVSYANAKSCELRAASFRWVTCCFRHIRARFKAKS